MRAVVFGVPGKCASEVGVERGGCQWGGRAAGNAQLFRQMLDLFSE